MKKLISLLLALIMVLSLCACGSEKPAADLESTPAPEETAALEEPAEPEETPAAEEEPVQEAIQISLGDTIENDNFIMTFDSVQLLPEYTFRTSDYSSTSLYVEEGYQLLLVTGHIENTSFATFSDSAFFRKAVVNDKFVVEDYDVRMTFKRDKSFEIDPYTDLDFFLYVNVPDKLADIYETSTFTLGFNDDMSIPSTVWNTDGTKTTETDNLYELTLGAVSSAS